MHGLIDIGANLTHESFSKDRAQVLERAREAGVTHIIVTGTSADDSLAARDLAAGHAGLLSATAGVHPHHASSFDDDTRALLCRLADDPRVVAIGETGLDFFRNFSTAEEQTHAFAAQIDLAKQVQLPVFLHQRDAHDDFMAILEPARAELAGGVAHCFTGDDRELGEYVDLDLYIGITGWICDERRGHHLKDLVRQIPLDRLLLETDAPYLLPRDLPSKAAGRRNEPALLAHILGVVADCLDLEPAELAQATGANAARLFGLSVSPDRR
jgi:TatD DNase family protein